MDKLTLKFMEEQRKNGDFCTNHADQCANITKEVACGFAEWIIDSGYSFDDHQEHETDTQGMWALGYNETYYTTYELFDLYIKSL